MVKADFPPWALRPHGLLLLLLLLLLTKQAWPGAAPLPARRRLESLPPYAVAFPSLGK